MTNLDEQLEYLLRPAGLMRRNVNLEGVWYHDAVGAFLGTLKTGGMVALLPHKIYGYTYFDCDTGKTVRLSKRTAPLLEAQAICFYKPLPLKKLGMCDLLRYIVELLSIADYAMVGAATLVVTLVGTASKAGQHFLLQHSGVWQCADFGGIWRNDGRCHCCADAA